MFISSKYLSVILFWENLFSKFFLKEFMNGKNFEKLHIKTVINIHQCARVSNFNKYGEH